ncbi:MAG TPA: pseudouridine synthase [Verrucomicrobiae bacterium]
MSLFLFEDEHLLVVNKPAGWNTHAPNPYAGEGIYDWLKHREPRWARLAIIHRLDKETSGVLVFGKTPEANRSLTAQFTARGTRKKYLLLTDRKVPSKAFTAQSQIVRAGEKYVSRTLHSGADRAETHFKMIRVHENRTLVEAEPITGRTHQIRVHAAEHGFPIYGDTLYGGTRAERVFLHAFELAVKHPAAGTWLQWKAPCEWSEFQFAIRPEICAVFIDPQQTNAFRIIHGAADGMPDFFVDKLGDYLLAQSEHELTEERRTRLQNLSETHRASGVYHKLLSRHVGGGGASASPRLVLGAAAPERFIVRENGLTFELSFSEGYSVGLFLDQRDNRRRLLVNHAAADFSLFQDGARRAEMLNAFAYTCGFSVAAAKAGARTTSLDLSKKYLEWGKQNFALNQIDPGGHDFIYGDAFEWMRRLAKKGRVFDVVVLDPPTFSQSKESGTWQAGKNYGQLVESALPLLKRGGVLFASTNAGKMEPEKFLNVIHEAIGKSRRKILQQHYVPQPPDFPITRSEPAHLKTAWMRIG